MATTKGINLVLIDRQELLTQALEHIGQVSVYEMSSIADVFQEPGRTYYHVLPNLKHMEAYSKLFNVDRGVMVTYRDVRYIGNDAAWVRSKTLAPRPLQSFRSFTRPVDDEDPYRELGYS